MTVKIAFFSSFILFLILIHHVLMGRTIMGLFPFLEPQIGANLSSVLNYSEDGGVFQLCSKPELWSIMGNVFLRFLFRAALEAPFERQGCERSLWWKMDAWSVLSQFILGCVLLLPLFYRENPIEI